MEMGVTQTAQLLKQAGFALAEVQQETIFDIFAVVAGSRIAL